MRSIEERVLHSGRSAKTVLETHKYVGITNMFSIKLRNMYVGTVFWVPIPPSIPWYRDTINPLLSPLCIGTQTIGIVSPAHVVGHGHPPVLTNVYNVHPTTLSLSRSRATSHTVGNTVGVTILRMTRSWYSWHHVMSGRMTGSALLRSMTGHDVAVWPSALVSAAYWWLLCLQCLRSSGCSMAGVATVCGHSTAIAHTVMAWGGCWGGNSIVMSTLLTRIGFYTVFWLYLAILYNVLQHGSLQEKFNIHTV